MNNIENMKKNKFIKHIIIGSISSIIITVILLLVYAIILANTNIKEDSINLVIIIITGISILIGSSIAGANLKKKGAIIGLSIGSVYFISTFILSSIIFQELLINTKTIIIVVSECLIGAIGGIIGINVKK